MSLHSLIDNNLSHPHYGQLLYHRDLQNPSILHFSVQLNDVESLAWEPIRCNQQKDTGKLAIWHIDWHRFQPAKWVNHWEREKINKALHLSVETFHERWQYELFRFNCEHWARLVTTGDCRCFQMTEFKKLQKIPVMGLIVVGVAGLVTGAWEQNGYAEDVITNVVIAA
ncbi:hypothetical protein [Calothrix sp. PCC 6303]|uniref:hypothetical protein n=1 Tax=Calothrix sp. PCC 6303 TaxID=1170562 RepID=UPI0002A03660|nr:hypothetical protein [Calothrix sp. PCC 6303]AFZ01851.1 hypothetical protein Cal6303_2900 [Calothrix sp. PCC 6303]